MEEHLLEHIMSMHRASIDSAARDESSLLDTIRDEGCIPSMIVGGSYIDDTFEKAAYYLHRVATRHPFVEGNKRTAFLLAATIIYSETGSFLSEDAEENDRFIRCVASDLSDVREIEAWLREHVIR